MILPPLIVDPYESGETTSAIQAPSMSICVDDTTNEESLSSTELSLWNIHEHCGLDDNDIVL